MRVFRKKTAQDRIEDAACAMVREYVAEHFSAIDLPGHEMGSPIERIFYVALLSTVRFGCTEFFCVDEQDAAVPHVDSKVLRIERQARLLDWPVDFAVHVKDFASNRIKTIAIECDGHEFHERTKAQAAKDRSRDRALQAAGYKVMRFTGSELWNKPMECAGQVADMASCIYADFLFEELDRGARS